MVGLRISDLETKEEYRLHHGSWLQQYNAMVALHTLFPIPGLDETGLCKESSVDQMVKAKIESG